jgi:hypothetical protein
LSLSDIAALATAGGVVLVVVQLILGRRDARTALEDDLAGEYRQLAASLPPAAFFDKEDPANACPPFQEHLREYVRYIDLSNQQVFLRMERRIRRRTWFLWRDGMHDNFDRTSFKNAWVYVRTYSPKSYDELASVYADWKRDPAWWGPPWWALPAKPLLRRKVRPEPWRPDGEAAPDLEVPRAITDSRGEPL